MEDKRKDYFLPGISILHQVEMTNVKVMSTVGPQSSQNLGIILHTKPKPSQPQFNAPLGPAILPLLQIALEDLFWHDCGTLCCILLNLFYGS